MSKGNSYHSEKMNQTKKISPGYSMDYQKCGQARNGGKRKRQMREGVLMIRHRLTTLRNNCVSPIRVLGCLIWVLVIPLAGCSGSEAPPELNQAVKVVGKMLTPRNLSRSAFYAAYPDGKPSDFVNYMFSPMGTVEWPPAADNREGLTVQDLRAAGITPMPKDVRLVPHTADPRYRKQVVVSADNVRGMVIAKGYIESDKEPVLVKEWPLRRVTLMPGVAEMYRSNRDMGMRNEGK